MQLSSTIFRLLFFKLNKAHLLQLNNTHLFAGNNWTTHIYSQAF